MSNFIYKTWPLDTRLFALRRSSAPERTQNEIFSKSEASETNPESTIYLNPWSPRFIALWARVALENHPKNIMH